MTTNIIQITKQNLHYILIFFLTLLSISSKNIAYLDIFFYILLFINFVYFTFNVEKKINFFVIFVVAFILDLFLFGYFGPHLISFCTSYFLIIRLRKYTINLNIKYLLLVSILLIMSIIIFVNLLGLIMYNFPISLDTILKKLIILFIIYYPTYNILNKF